jgi:hypothetical protein
MSDLKGSGRYKIIQTVKMGDAGETYTCEDLHDTAGGRFTLLSIRDHQVMHRFVDIYTKSEHDKDKTVVNEFSEDGKFFIVYPYIPERPLTAFFMAGARTLHEKEEICTNLIIACMTSDLPWPLLYLVLKQREIQLANNKDISLSYKLDLTELDEEKKEEDCALECAKIIQEMLKPTSGRTPNSYLLLSKRTEKKSYRSFRDLYKDLEISAEPDKKRGPIGRFFDFLSRNKDEIFRVLLWVSTILFIFVVITFITNLIFGDVPWLRLFIRSFEKIGLESLLQ